METMTEIMTPVKLTKKEIAENRKASKPKKLAQKTKGKAKVKPVVKASKKKKKK